MIVNENKLKQFLQDNNLLDKWRQHKNPTINTYGPPAGWSESPERLELELKQTIQKTVNSTRLVNGKGIKEIDFSIQHTEEVQSGKKLTIEIKGVAKATDLNEIRRMLENLSNSAKNSLASQGCYLRIKPQTLHANENKEENFEFVVMAVALLVN